MTTRHLPDFDESEDEELPELVPFDGEDEDSEDEEDDGEDDDGDDDEEDDGRTPRTDVMPLAVEIELSHVVANLLDYESNPEMESSSSEVC